VVSTLAQLYSDRTLSDREKHLAYTLGWCIEIVSNLNCVVNMIMVILL